MNRLLTFPQRASKRGSRALALLFIAGLALVSSCGTDYQNCPDCPGSPALVPGTFELAAVDGLLLPYTSADSSFTVLSGNCTTTADEKFTLTLTTVTRTVAKSDTVTATTSGFVLPFNKGTVTFHFSASAVQAQALINGAGFSLQYNALTLQFDRTG
ncbi:MAG TPA: hypothetical protein VF461_23440 [Gemmatimonadaceae bacterium]